jgi:hypothetical protein
MVSTLFLNLNLIREDKVVFEIIKFVYGSDHIFHFVTCTSQRSLWIPRGQILYGITKDDIRIFYQSFPQVILNIFPIYLILKFSMKFSHSFGEKVVDVEQDVFS